MDLITKNDVVCVSFLRTIEEVENTFDGILKNCRPSINGNRYLTDREVPERLKISRRTLQEYRNDGRITYYMIGGKVLYLQSDIEKILAKIIRHCPKNYVNKLEHISDYYKSFFFCLFLNGFDSKLFLTFVIENLISHIFQQVTTSKTIQNR